MASLGVPLVSLFWQFDFTAYSKLLKSLNTLFLDVVTYNDFVDYGLSVLDFNSSYELEFPRLFYNNDSFFVDFNGLITIWLFGKI